MQTNLFQTMHSEKHRDIKGFGRGGAQSRNSVPQEILGAWLATTRPKTTYTLHTYNTTLVPTPNMSCGTHTIPTKPNLLPNTEPNLTLNSAGGREQEKIK